ncbi:hypothetical protein [Paenibacillus sp. 453mf]|uniref:hypothetical protein n=1 Tax=Paenibacillus sp. 453mf TaxID=1761874 RepID=UPI00147A97E3|nr:hypothetical protein [Paenibacillus sp. 453mf]
MNEQQLTKAETLSAIKKMDLADYRLRAMQIHNRIFTRNLRRQEGAQQMAQSGFSEGLV